MPDEKRSRRAVLASIPVAGTVGLAGCSRAEDETTSRPDSDSGVDGSTTARSQEQSETKTPREEPDLIRESAWVETASDTDGSGELDRAHVYVVRQQAADGDEPVSAIMRAAPYGIPPIDSEKTAIPSDDDTAIVNGPRAEIKQWPSEAYTSTTVPLTRSDGNASEGATDKQSALSRQGSESMWPNEVREYYIDMFVPEGYAYVGVSPIGTGFSTGCNMIGGPASIASIRSAIDWLNGRATAYASRDGNTEVTAGWTTGRVGMIGKSYPGTLPTGVAATGVDGLETIVPMAASSSWYRSDRSNGAVIHSDPERGEASPVTTFGASWTTRENPNVCTDQLQELTEQLDRDSGNYTEFWRKRDYLRNAAQIDASVLLIHGLYDYNMMPRELSKYPAALREHDIPYKIWAYQGDHTVRPAIEYEQTWRELLSDWFGYWLKDRDTGVMDRPTAIVEQPDGDLAGEPDWPSPRSERTTMYPQSGDGPWGSLTTDRTASEKTASFIDNSDVTPEELASVDDATHRLVYRTSPLSAPLRVSGPIRLDLTVTLDTPAALLSGAVLDYGPDGAAIVDRGWMDLRNRNSIVESEPLEPGTEYSVSLPLEPTEYVFEENRQLGIMVYSTDASFTNRPPSSPMITVSLADSTIAVPVVGGNEALQAATTAEDVNIDLYGDRYPLYDPE